MLAQSQGLCNTTAEWEWDMGMEVTFRKTPKADFAACFKSGTQSLWQADLQDFF